MIVPYKPGEGIWLRVAGGEIIATVLDRCRDECGGMLYLVLADDGSRFLVGGELARPIWDEPMV